MEYNKSNLENLVNKINNLLEKINPLSTSNKKIIKKSLKLWNMDTSLKTIIDNFKFQIGKIIFKWVNIENIYNRIFLNVKKINNKYNFLIEKMNVTPTIKNELTVAKTTKNQYLRVLTFFGLLDRNTLNSLESNIFSLTNKFITFYYAKSVDEWWKLDNIISFIKFGINSENYDFRTMVYSFLICLIYHLDESKTITSKIEYFTQIQFLKNKKFKGEYTFDLPYYEKIEKTIKDTYKDLIYLTKNKIIEEMKLEDSNNMNKFNNYEILEFFLNLINNNQSYTYSGSFYHKNRLKEILNEINFDNKISSSRSKLRKNILKARNYMNDLHYSDIEPINNVIYLHDSIEQQEAAHIFSVENIKKLKNVINEKDLLLQLEDPNNGILMDYVYHDAYDKGWLSLELDGHFEPQQEWKKRYYVNNKPHDKYPIMKIKNDVYNSLMKQYIEKMKKQNEK